MSRPPKPGRFALRRARPLLSTVVAAALHGSAAIAAAPPAPLSLGACKPTFNDDFNDLSASAWGPGTRWIAHTPWNGDFGDAQFSDPRPGFPFTIEHGVLRIEARKGPDGTWRSGLLSTTDAHGNGFAQTYGYFEMRAKLPPGEGVWPAFWLVTADLKADPRIEIDAIEYYGVMTDKYFVTTHVWHNDKTLTHSETQPVAVGGGALSQAFHTYGVLVDHDWIVYYLDRQEVLRQRTPPEHTRPMGVLINLALGGGWPSGNAPSPSYFYVDYVRAYPIPATCAGTSRTP
ncbi:MAG: glycoside hydrolase family 16 protein [Caulobacteraceae bacterium]|nr:glycoside hydrolase family 16 protein [Caulobacteraceae bacterium]